MQRKRSGLGRGLDALIPGTEDISSKSGVLEISPELIEVNPRQPRSQFHPEALAGLVDSIKEHGIIQPLIVSQDPDSQKFVLIAGERRLIAAREAGLHMVPVIVREASDQDHLELALIENIQRSDLNPLEAAEAYRQLSDEFALSHDEIAQRVGKSRTTITNTLRLLKLPSEIHQAILDQEITEGHARALLALQTSQSQLACLEIIREKSLSVRQTEELVKKYLGKKSATPKRDIEQDPSIREIETRLRSVLGTKVRLNHGKKGGSITIHFYSDEELENILNLILND